MTYNIERMRPVVAEALKGMGPLVPGDHAPVNVRLLAALKEATKWQAEGEHGDPLPETYCSPEYRAFMEWTKEIIAEAEAELPDGLTYSMTSSVGVSKWIGLHGQGFRPIGVVFQNSAGRTGSLTEHGRVVWEQGLAHPCQGHARQQEAEEAAAPTYSYSTDGETFYGTFATPEAAAADYLRDGDDDSSVEVGRNERRTANDYVGEYHIESLLEMVGENAYEECGDCAESWLSDLTKDADQLTELKQVVGDWIQRNEPPGFWHVEDIRRITRSELIASGHLVQRSKAGG